MMHRLLVPLSLLLLASCGDKDDEDDTREVADEVCEAAEAQFRTCYPDQDASGYAASCGEWVEEQKLRLETAMGQSPEMESCWAAAQDVWMCRYELDCFDEEAFDGTTPPADLPDDAPCRAELFAYGGAEGDGGNDCPQVLTF